MPHGKNHYVNKPDETWAEVDVPGEDLRVLVPDNRYAYGDNESVAQMAQDVVGKRAGNEAATQAYEQAREQLETTDFKTLKRQQARQGASLGITGQGQFSHRRLAYERGLMRDNLGLSSLHSGTDDLQLFVWD